MSDSQRRDAFRRYLKDELGGNRAVLMARTGLTKGRVAQLLNDKEAFGEKAAVALARKLGLRPDYFLAQSERLLHNEQSRHPALSDEQRELLALWEPLFEDERATFLGQLRQAHANALRRIEEMHRRGLDKFIPDGALDEKVWSRPAQRDLPIETRTGTPRVKKNTK